MAGIVFAIAREISWIGVGPDPLRQRQGYIYRAVHREPGAPVRLGQLEPLHGVDDLERRTDDEFRGPVQPAAQDHRFGIG